MRKLSERQRLVLTILVIVALTGGLVTLIFMDRKEIDGFEAEIVTLDERIHIADAEISRTKEREDRVLVFRAVENRELAVLPTRQMIAGFHSNLSLFLTSAGVRFRELPESTAVESELAKGIYVTRTTVSCEGDAASLLKLMNMLENDPRLVAVKGLRVTAGERDLDEPETSVIHEVELTLETYFYNPEAAAGVPALPIAGAERRLEDPGIKEAIASFQPERPDTYILRPATSRRDPFVDPRKVKVQEDPEALAQAFIQQEPTVIDLENRLRDVSEKDEQVKAYIATGDLFRRDRLEAEIEGDLNEMATRLAQIDQMKALTIPALQQRAMAVRTRLDGLRGRRSPREMVVTVGVALTTLADVKAAFAKGDLQEVNDLTSQWQTFLRGKQVNTDAAAVVDEIGSYRHKAQTISEFRQRPIRVTGTMVNHRDESKSLAVVNGRSLHKGDRLDDKGEVLVAGIVADGVDFLFGGEVIRVERKSAGEDEKVKKPAPGRGGPNLAPSKTPKPKPR